MLDEACRCLVGDTRTGNSIAEGYMYAERIGSVMGSYTFPNLEYFQPHAMKAHRLTRTDIWRLAVEPPLLRTGLGV